MIPLSVAWDDIGGLVDAHERFLAGALVDATVRDSVLDSWKRCRSAGLEPDQLLVPYAPDLMLEDRFLRAADPVLADLSASLTEVGMTIALCDARGRMVQRLGGDRQLRDRLDEVRFAPGFDASERVVGTNGVGTALAERSPVFVVGREHFADCLQPFACAGAPVRDPFSGRIEAVLDLTCLRTDSDPTMLRLVREAARGIEARLLEQSTQRERALLAAYRRAGPDVGGWPRQPRLAAADLGDGRGDGGLGRIDLAVLREKAEELLASPQRTLDEVVLSGGRVATLLRRPVMGAAGETGVVVEARILGGPRLRQAGSAAAGTGSTSLPEAGVTGSGSMVAGVAAAGPPGAGMTAAEVTALGVTGVGSAAGPPGAEVTPAGPAKDGAPSAGPAEAGMTAAEVTALGVTGVGSAAGPPGAEVTPAGPGEDGALSAGPAEAGTTAAGTPSSNSVTDVPPAPAPTAARALAEAPAAPVPVPAPTAGAGTLLPAPPAKPPVPTLRPLVAVPSVTVPAAPQPAPAADTDSSSARTRPGEDDGGTDDRLLLVGEPGVGRLAVLARRRLELLHDAGVRIGTTLDVTRTAEELTEVAVSRFADFTAVDLPDAVLQGDEPGPFGSGGQLRRIALGSVQKVPYLYGVGDPVHYLPSTPQARSLESRQSVLEPVLVEAEGWLAQDPARLEQVLAAGIHSLITVPLRARGATLGVVSFYRSEKPAPFEEDDLSLAQELAGRAAICIDNARRYTREHNTALALQRSLLPRGRPEQSAVDVAYRYLPAQAGVGGDWFDVIPLSGARVALVVGDVVGHGLHAAATMGRLRTAVHNFCSLDLPPDDLLTHLDDLVGRLDRGEGWAVDNSQADCGIVGATCLYAVYDPVSRRCTLTRAGHPFPAVVAPDGTVEFVELPSAPPLGLGGMPFETVELELAEGSQLVLYTDGLIEDRHRDIDSGLDLLRTVLAHADRAPEDTCEAVLDALLPERPSDDVALLVARTHVLGPDQVAQWDLPSDPAVVSRARAAVTEQLAAWGLEDLAFCTELIASELVTNAIRHATGPVQLRLLRDRALICEVSDGSSTSPRLRRARTEDEGGRGLFLVAQLTERWGTRYTPNAKIIWTEQPLPHTS
ncbi:SpoIIE family protein phosphatase [Streptomyces sp. AC555_RSS877]|uniref:SpoIIE family protein phosphatase n=1 Tax=Streptomyces sp. AC555_RSS877 TaxID=2823688 RepID=UPI0027E4C7BC|nr:SpoIIE family protein phosphatase [Streptomyces sp. AC555_RSS877]